MVFTVFTVYGYFSIWASVAHTQIEKCYFILAAKFVLHMGNYLDRAAPAIVLEAVRLVVERRCLDKAIYLTDDEMRKVRKFLKEILEPSEKERA